MRTHLFLLIVFLSFLYPVFSQNPTGSYTDARDGKVYKTVKIGGQWWMAENLAWLPSVSPPAARSFTEPYYYVYDYNDTDVSSAKSITNYSTYGVLYNWPAALTACPEGWHLPSDAEWTTLENYLISNGYNYNGTTSGNNIAKSMATATVWNSSSGTGTVGNTDYPAYRNKSGFSALPGGYRGTNGTFYVIGYNGNWWSSTENSATYAWIRNMNCYYTNVYRSNHGKKTGFSVRCLRDL